MMSRFCIFAQYCHKNLKIPSFDTEFDHKLEDFVNLDQSLLQIRTTNQESQPESITHPSLKGVLTVFNQNRPKRVISMFDLDKLIKLFKDLFEIRRASNLSQHENLLLDFSRKDKQSDLNLPFIPS